MDGTWKAWSIRIGDFAYNSIRPISASIKQEVEYSVVGKRWGIFNIVDKAPTGNWILLLKYDHGPVTVSRVDKIPFKSEKEARQHFNWLYNNVFAGKNSKIINPPPKSTKKTGLRIVKNKDKKT